MKLYNILIKKFTKTIPRLEKLSALQSFLQELQINLTISNFKSLQVLNYLTE